MNVWNFGKKLLISSQILILIWEYNFELLRLYTIIMSIVIYSTFVTLPFTFIIKIFVNWVVVVRVTVVVGEEGCSLGSLVGNQGVVVVGNDDFSRGEWKVALCGVVLLLVILAGDYLLLPKFCLLIALIRTLKILTRQFLYVVAIVQTCSASIFFIGYWKRLADQSFLIPTNNLILITFINTIIHQHLLMLLMLLVILPLVE